MILPINRWISSVARWAGSSLAVVFAVLFVSVYVIIGITFGFTDKYNLIVNTIMSAIGYILLFVIQYTQDLHVQITKSVRDHDSKAIHIKLDEIIHALYKADNDLIGAQHATEEQLDHFAERYDLESHAQMTTQDITDHEKAIHAKLDKILHTLRR
jgi:low affinity Fe/Cu permease